MNKPSARRRIDGYRKMMRVFAYAFIHIEKAHRQRLHNLYLDLVLLHRG